MTDSNYFDRKQLNKFLSLLVSAKNLNTTESYIYIKNILNMVEFTIPFFIYPKGQRFVRTRVHTNNEDYFTKVDQLTYRKDIQNITRFGRANEPGQSLFYCSNDDTLSFVETSHIARNLEEKEFEFSTNSLWIAQENLSLVSLLTNDDIKGKHSEIDSLSKSFESLINSQGDESAEVVRELLNFMSVEFSRVAENDSNHYKITAAFSNYIFNEFENVDGILYPSTLYPTKGFNFVFKQSTVEKKLKFYVASRRKMVLNGEKSYYETEMKDSQVNTNQSNTIIW